MALKKFLFIALALLLFGSCIPYRSIDIQYYDKPKQSLPITSGKVLL